MHQVRPCLFGPLERIEIYRPTFLLSHKYNANRQVSFFIALSHADRPYNDHVEDVVAKSCQRQQQRSYVFRFLKVEWIGSLGRINLYNRDKNNTVPW